MPEKQFNINWCQLNEIPKEGGVCPKCSVGELRKSQYYEGVYCSNCKWSWRKSKWESEGDKKEYSTPLKVEPKIVVDGNAMLMDELQEGFKGVNERLDKLIAHIVTREK